MVKCGGVTAVISVKGILKIELFKYTPYCTIEANLYARTYEYILLNYASL